MGTGMAGRLIAAGHSLSVYNRNPERSAPFGRLGARVAGSARSAAERADIIIGMTADDESSRAVWLGDFGALAADNLPDALAIECSTLSHDWVLELAHASGLMVAERSVARAECERATELFVTGSVAGIRAVTELDGRSLDCAPGPVTQRLQAVYAEALAAAARIGQGGGSGCHPGRE